MYFSRIPVWVFPCLGSSLGHAFPSLRDDHFPRFRRWRPTLTMFKYIYTSTPSRAHQNGSTSVTIHGHVFVFDSTRLVHVQEDRLNCWRPSDNHNIFIYTHAFHITLINTFTDSRFVTISIRTLSSSPRTSTFIFYIKIGQPELPDQHLRDPPPRSSSAMIAGEHGLAHSHHDIITIYDRRHQHDYMNTRIERHLHHVSSYTGCVI